MAAGGPAALAGRCRAGLAGSSDCSLCICLPRSAIRGKTLYVTSQGPLGASGPASGLLVHLYASRRHWMDISAECLFVVKEALSQELWSNLVIRPRRGKAGWLAAQLKALPEKPGEAQKQHHQLRCPHLFFPRLPLSPKALRRMTRRWRKAGWRTDRSHSEARSQG